MVSSRLFIAVIVLCVYAIALPVRLPRGSAAGADADCLTIADRAPAPRADLVATLERCAALYPDDVELLADLGAQYEAREAPARAEETYRRALVVDPAYADLRLRLGRLLLRRGAAAEARREVETALRVQPNRQVLLDLQREADRQLAAPTPTRSVAQIGAPTGVPAGAETGAPAGTQVGALR